MDGLEKLQVIGRGSFGQVFKCRDTTTGEFVAVKEIDLDEDHGDDCFDELRSEIGTLLACDHPNIIRYRRSFVPSRLEVATEGHTGNRLCIVMDYCELGSLRQVVDRCGMLPERVVAEVAEAILHALRYLHGQGIGHRDLKAANVLADAQGRVKLGDFGVAMGTEASDDKLVGSPYWMAPEVILASQHKQSGRRERRVSGHMHVRMHYDGAKADIWSLGITLIELLKGRPPLAYLSPEAAMLTIPATTPPRLESADTHASKPLRNLIHACLHDDPTKRPTAAALLNTFKGYFKLHSSTHAPQRGSLSLLRLIESAGSQTVTASEGDLEEQMRMMRLDGVRDVSDTILSQWDFDLSDTVSVLEGDSAQDTLHVIASRADTLHAIAFHAVSLHIVTSHRASASLPSLLEQEREHEEETLRRMPRRSMLADCEAQSLRDASSDDGLGDAGERERKSRRAPTVRLRSLTSLDRGSQSLSMSVSSPSSTTMSSSRSNQLTETSSGWDNTDRSLLPIPRPIDAPDLSVPQHVSVSVEDEEPSLGELCATYLQRKSVDEQRTLLSALQIKISQSLRSME